MHAFDNAHNIVIHNLNQTENRTRDVNGFKLLRDNVVRGAAYNSGERFDAPKCHPETRTAVLSSIKSWVDSNDKERVMWLHGPAGAGKSAIAQTTAVNCDEEGKLAATFFFSRLAGRNNKDGLIATIAYQLCVSVPAVKDYIVKNVERNPKIFEADIKTQMESLVIKPLSLVPLDSSTGVIPMLLIIDGLDECEYKVDQAEIIESVSTSLYPETKAGRAAGFGSKLRVLVVSRPELKIRCTFNDDKISPLRTIMSLDDSFNPDDDIELYLRSHFQVVKRQHILGPLLSESWPSDSSIRNLVTKSSGQFIYASTVVYFVSDAEHDPRKRLEIILKIRPIENDDNPFAQLDLLYSTVLSMCKDYTKAKAIFEAMMFIRDKSSEHGMLKSLNDLEIFLSLQDEIMLVLANLHSIVDINSIKKNGIRFYHASLFDYLVESSRSHAFYINQREGHVHLSMMCLQHIMNFRLENPLFASVVKFCLEECFIHFRLSGWDDRVLHYIRTMDVLKPDIIQLEQLYSRYSDGTAITMLSLLIKSSDERTGSNDKDICAIIDDEILNHLARYPRKDIVYILLLEDQNKQRSSIAYKLHTNFMEGFSTGYMNIMKRDIFDVTNWDLREWFVELLNDTDYIHKVPEDIPIKAVFCILDYATKERDPVLMNTSVISLLHKIIDKNLRLSETASNALLEKWNTVENVLRCFYGDRIVSEGKEIIECYCERVKELSANSRNASVKRDVKGLPSASSWIKKIFCIGKRL